METKENEWRKIDLHLELIQTNQEVFIGEIIDLFIKTKWKFIIFI